MAQTATPNLEELRTNAILELWHTSRTALAGKEKSPTRYDRMLYVKEWLIKDHRPLIATLSNKEVWMLVDDTTTTLK